MEREIIKDLDVLTRKSEPFVFGEDDMLVSDLLDTANAHKGNCVGLAAIQIGVPKRVIVVRQGDNFVPYVNPVIIKKSREIYTTTEGCLSLEGERTVKRHRSIKVMWTLPNGKKKSQEFHGLIAEIIQHEYDHLNGKLI
jgi:peptide deformylase